MPIEIRPVDAGDIVDWLRLVPEFAGTPGWEPEPAAWWAGIGVGPSFGKPADEPALLAAAAQWPDVGRIRAAFVDGKLVGTAQMFSLELTVPGRGPVPMGGVTAVGVLPTHRRLGLLRAMMRELVDDCRERGEAVAGLSASEAGIYGRYGFGPATYQIRWELDRAAVSWSSHGDVAPRLELVDEAAALTAWPQLHDRVRQGRVGEVSAHGGFWAGRAKRTDGQQFVHHLDSDHQVDGAAVYRTPFSPDATAAGSVAVDWLETATEDAYAELWAFLCSLDLTKRVVAGKRAVDEPLRWRLRDPRALRVTRHSDDLWIRLVDVPGALGARNYQIEASVVIEVDDVFCPWNTGRWQLEGGPGGGTCTRAAESARSELAMTAGTLGSIYLGGTLLGPLTRGGLIAELVPGAVARLTAMLTRPEAPHNAIGF